MIRTPPSTRILIWNVQWAVPGTARGALIRRVIDGRDPDVICLTEGYLGFLPEGGHVIASEADYGYPSVEGRRKVLLWSRAAWTDPDPIGAPELPSGRYVAGTTSTPAGDLRLHGVCIPWRDAHVRTGRRDRKRWEDHLRYLAAFPTVLDDEIDGPRIVLGDFNQRIPRKFTPKRVHEPMLAFFGAHFEIPTAGPIDGVDRLAIDHLAHTRQLQARRVRGISDHASDGTRLSDHFGLEVELERAGAHS